MSYILIGPVIIICIILLIVIPRRKKMKAKQMAILAEAGKKLEDAPIKSKNITGETNFIDENYMLFYCHPTGYVKYDIKEVKSMDILSQRINGNRTYYLCFKNSDGTDSGKGIHFASLKQAEKMQDFVQKYVDKLASEQ